MIPKQLALLPIIGLWVLLVWNGKIELAIESGAIYLLEEEIRTKIVYYLGYGPILLTGALILIRTSTSTSSSEDQSAYTHDEDDQELSPS